MKQGTEPSIPTTAPVDSVPQACPCLHVKPCVPRCTCIYPWSSSGCSRCCSYGDKEQQRMAAEFIASAIDEKMSGTETGSESRE